MTAPTAADIETCKRCYPAIAAAVKSVFAGANRLPSGNLAAFLHISDRVWAAAKRELPAIIAYLEAHQTEPGHWRRKPANEIPKEAATTVGPPCTAVGGFGGKSGDAMKQQAINALDRAKARVERQMAADASGGTNTGNPNGGVMG